MEGREDRIASAGSPAGQGSPPRSTVTTRKIAATVSGLSAGCDPATWAGCHGSDAKGTPLGPDLTSSHWLWGDGSLPAITQIITDGVPHPKQYPGVMPPMGGAQLAPAEVSAVAAYVWALSHQSGR